MNRLPAWALAALAVVSIALVAVIAVRALDQRETGAASAPPWAPAGDERPPGLAMPNRAISPGDVFPDITVNQICTPGYASKTRNVSTATKDAVYKSYGITSHKPGQYEVDHIVPLALGGSNEATNLYPQPAEPRPGFHEKDVLETTLHDLVCGGTVDLRTAQQAIAVDWYAAYLTYVLRR